MTGEEEDNDPYGIERYNNLTEAEWDALDDVELPPEAIGALDEDADEFEEAYTQNLREHFDEYLKQGKQEK